MNLKGEPARVGRHCGGSTYTATPEVVAFYADALDDRSALYAELAPPLLYHSECYRFVGEWYLKNLFGNLHARQDWELFAPIEVGATLRTRSTIVERYQKRGRDYVVNETDVLSAADGRLLVRGRTHQSFLPALERAGEGGALDAPGAALERAGEGGALDAPGAARERAGDGFVVDASTAARKAEREPFPTATGRELPPLRKRVDARRCWMFSGPGRNYHTDRDAAQELGFPNIVVQGMMSTCFAAQLMQDAFGRGWVEGGRMSAKLVNVLWVDESVVARGRVREEVPEGDRVRVHCELWVDKDDGSRILAATASALR